LNEFEFTSELEWVKVLLTDLENADGYIFSSSLKEMIQSIM